MNRVVLKKEYRQSWVDSGYVESFYGRTKCRMGSAEICLPPPPHLRRVYHLAPSSFGISNIALKRLKVARLADLNDPFESMSVTWRELNLKKRSEEWKALYDQLIGLLCFSQNWTNPVLWSHYADKHKGICLGFDVPRADAVDIAYEEHRLEIKLPDKVEQLPPDLERKVLNTKFKDWAYEREVRVKVPLEGLASEGPLRFLSFSQSLTLREVILGEQCPISLATVRSLVAPMMPMPITFRARLAGQSYNVVPDVRRPDEPESEDAV